ncbi:quinone-dependent dihydroorotate dehydrogenase [Methylocella sp.]|uniref:quinone-dependent dihydroorotate dehydrogenase n=1 Tax=Methylocella sp. TaxID=1978226 RepID=UPI003C21DA85
MAIAIDRQGVIAGLSAIARPLMLHLDPETAHSLAIKSLARLPLSAPNADDPRLAVKAFGLEFSNPLGLAAGFDKNGEAVHAILALGFGFTEVGTVTPLPQAGNPRPRLFRLTRDEAVINRFGFNSQGFAAVESRLARRKSKSGIIGVNIGANKDSADRAADYAWGVAAFASIADYFTINVSSPNTPGLRDLQQSGALDDLLARVIAARDHSAALSGRKPVLLKIAPDLSLAALDSLIACARARKIDGLIVSNSTLSRPTLLDAGAAKEQGGLSGRPLFALSTQMLAAAYLRVEGQFPLIGVGGVDSAARAFAKIEAGASLVQLYSSLVFKGLGLPAAIKQGLLLELERKSYPRIGAAIGARAGDWAAGAI